MGARPAGGSDGALAWPRHDSRQKRHRCPVDHRSLTTNPEFSPPSYRLARSKAIVAHAGAHTGEPFAHAEGPSHIVIRPVFEHGDVIPLSVPHRKHDKGHICTLAQLSA